jgi:hypothetical protein
MPSTATAKRKSPGRKRKTKREIAVADLQGALEILEGRDRVGRFAEWLAAAAGVAGGAAAAGPLATYFGASTLLGSTALGSALGGILVTTTPIGWTVGGIVGGGALAIALIKMIRSGARQDEIRKKLRMQLETRLAKLKRPRTSSDTLEALRVELRLAVDEGKIDVDRAYRVTAAVDQGKLSAENALAAIRRFVHARDSAANASQTKAGGDAVALPGNRALGRRKSAAGEQAPKQET